MRQGTRVSVLIVNVSVEGALLATAAGRTDSLSVGGANPSRLGQGNGTSGRRSARLAGLQYILADLCNEVDEPQA